MYTHAHCRHTHMHTHAHCRHTHIHTHAHVYTHMHTHTHWGHTHKHTHAYVYTYMYKHAHCRHTRTQSRLMNTVAGHLFNLLPHTFLSLTIVCFFLISVTALHKTYVCVSDVEARANTLIYTQQQYRWLASGNFHCADTQKGTQCTHIHIQTLTRGHTLVTFPHIPVLQKKELSSHTLSCNTDSWT